MVASKVPAVPGLLPAVVLPLPLDFLHAGLVIEQPHDRVAIFGLAPQAGRHQSVRRCHRVRVGGQGSQGAQRDSAPGHVPVRVSQRLEVQQAGAALEFEETRVLESAVVNLDPGHAIPARRSPPGPRNDIALYASMIASVFR